MEKKYTFSGHESFQCRQLWPKKGYDFISSGKSFNDDDAAIMLGVGKNMVASIRFWMKSFGLLSLDDKITPFADKLLANDGWDPYLEDEASLWLLHYHLVKSGIASTYSLVFNEFRREKIEFTRENYISFVKRKAESTGQFQANEKTIHDDFNVFVKLYLRTSHHLKDKEDSFSGILSELDLIKAFSRGKDDYFVIENTDRTEIPDEVILYSILEAGNFDQSVNLITLEQEPNSIGIVYSLSKGGLLNKIESLASKPANGITFNDHAGIKELQFKKKLSPLTVLDKYYAN
ncbi:DUF4007 family protein [Polluticoccus soli]|uniref:DUF4007 family protein n=1 Tax=Polluticoccus soli TaxID=3034150 RepID=UPI0023E1A60E|nr:DUF4007 family protein [Flavipsychrobacter sp. JY13-12]